MGISINQNTKICISISKNPGSTGSKFHNTAYELLKLNYIYFPIKIDKLDNIKNLIKKFNLKGCSVSMPFKEQIIKYLDLKDISVLKTNAVNTLIFKNKKLKGYNTDYYAANILLKKVKLKKIDKVLVLGNGGVSKTIFECLKKIKISKIYLCSRNKKKYKNWVKTNNSEILNWNERNKKNCYLLINGTSIGMKTKKCPISLKSLNNFSCILDLVINSKSNLKKLAINKKIRFYDGLEFSFIQASKQFQIYTNKKVNLKKLKKKLNYNF